jgi:hypothetical protein
MSAFVKRMPENHSADCVKCGPIWPCIEHYPSPLSPWAQEVVDRCKAEGRKATEVESFVLYAELANLIDHAEAALDADA